MGLNDPDRETKPLPSKDKDENPFIKFKRFADAQIGAVLQGIIGLPSVFSKQPNDANSRWADLHDDLKRRDKALEHKQPPEASESSRSEVDSEDMEVDIPVKKSPGWLSSAGTQAGSLTTPKLGNKDDEQQPIDLFSPLTKSLFAHLIRDPMDNVDWSSYEALAQFQNRSFGYTTLNLQRKLRSDQRVGSGLDMIQSMILNTLNNPSTGLENSHLFTSPSVLPYILFSAYSPLALSSMPPLVEESMVFEHPQDDFPYCAAFEDLLLVSQGRPMATLAHVPAYFRDLIDSITPTDFRDRELWKANSGMLWIERLWYYGLLTKEHPSVCDVTRLFDENPSRTIYTKPARDVKTLVETTSKQQEGHDTEQEVYDFLERIGGSLASPLPFRDAMQAMEAFIKDAVNYLAEQENINAGSKPDYSESSTRKTAKSNPDHDKSGILRQLGYTGCTSTSTQTETFTEHGTQANATRSAESDQIDELQDGPAVLPATERVVATTTTTQQTTDEDGSVRTTLMIQKTFADGRTSVTTTTKTDFPPRDRHFTKEEWSGLPEDERCPHCDDKYDEKESLAQKKEKKSKGWFWN
jgi:hypothetical protein